MDAKSRELMNLIDEEIEKITKADREAKIGEIVSPVVSKIAAEHGVDEVDLLVDYMDHVAISSKKFAQIQQQEQQIDLEDLEKGDFKLY